MRFPKAGSIQAKERILLRYTMGFQNSKTSGHPRQVETILVTTGDRSETIKVVKVGSNIKEEIGEFTKQIASMDFMHSLPDDEFE